MTDGMTEARRLEESAAVDDFFDALEKYLRDPTSSRRLETVTHSKACGGSLRRFGLSAFDAQADLREYHDFLSALAEGETKAWDRFLYLLGERTPLLVNHFAVLRSDKLKTPPS